VTPERFREIQRLFHAVQETSAVERTALLARADPELRREVESLLARQPERVLLDTPLGEIGAQFPAEPQSPKVSTGTCLGPYRIEGKLGEGGMGAVFRAVDTRLGRSVAIKITHDRFSARFAREAHAISALNHPHICTLYDVGSQYLVMELLEGETLAARLKRGPLPFDLALHYGSQILSALGDAHERGFIHRDLKPGNVMLTRTGAKVLDFGLAAVEGDTTLTTQPIVLGTPAYMAPEQREGKPADARTDIYAFGCVLYEMLTGARATLRRRRLPSRALEQIVSRCLKEDRGRRWASALELREALTTASRTGHGTRGAAAAAAVLIASAAAAYFVAHRSLPLTVKDPIVLADFENKTGDPVFDETLREGMAVQLEQSPFLALVSEQHVQQVLRFMNRVPETRLTPEVAREVCERTASAAVLEGSIAALGNQYVLWLRARNCRTGDVLAEEQAQATRKEDVLNALTRIAMQMRSRLGESLATIEEHSTPLEEATTPSLDALKAYSASRTVAFAHGGAAAIPHLQRAIAIDPQFAMAYADMSIYDWIMGETDLSAEHTRKAYDLRNRVSAREKFFILFLYDRQVTGNLQRELQTLESWRQTYPRDFLPLSLLAGWGTRGTGQYERGVRAAEAGLRLNPDDSFAYDSLFLHNFLLDRFAAAADALRRAADRKLEIPEYQTDRYYLAFLNGDPAGMEREATLARGTQGVDDWMSHNQALVLARSGRMREARVMWQRAIALAQQTGDDERAAIFEAAESVCEAHLGNTAAARTTAEGALRLAKGRDVEYASAIALTLAGDASASQRLIEDLQKRFPEDTSVQFEYVPTLTALSARVHGAAGDAVSRLEKALPYDLALPGTAFFAKFGGLYPAYVRGEAYLQERRGREAAAEFQKILDHRGIVYADPIGVLARLQLGRALALSGDWSRSRNAYQDFLALWKDADPDVPILEEAKAEFAKTQAIADRQR